MAYRPLHCLRFLILFLLIFLCTNVICNVFIASFLIVCAKNYTSNDTQEDIQRHTIDWVSNSNIQSMALSSVTWSALIFSVPAGLLMQHFGPRSIMTVLGLLSAVATYLSPVAAYSGYYYFMLAHIVQGLAYTASYTAIATVAATWSPIYEIGFFIAFASISAQLAGVITMPVSAKFCASSVGWPGTYYFFAVLTTIASVFWFLGYRNNPGKHPLITDKEMLQIQFKKEQMNKSAQKKVPWKQILTHLPNYAIIASSFGYMWAQLLLVIFGPRYLKEAVMMDVQNSGFWAAVPFFADVLCKLFAGLLSDKVHCINGTVRIKLMNSVSLFGCACFILAMSFSRTKTCTLVFMTLAFGFLGSAAAGHFKSIPLVGQAYTSIITGAVQFTGTLVMLILPFIINAMTPNATYTEWNSVLYLTVTILALSGTCFAVFGKGEPGPWAEATNRLA